VVESPVRSRELVQLHRVLEQLLGVRPVFVFEEETGGGERRRRFPGQVGARMVHVDLVGGPRHVQVFGAAPEGVVHGEVAHLAVKLKGGNVALDEVVGGPLDGIQAVVALTLKAVIRSLGMWGRDGGSGGRKLRKCTCFGVGVVEGEHPPGEDRGGEGHGEGELDEVAGVVVAPAEVLAVEALVVEGGVSPPTHAVRLRQPAGSLRFVEEEGQLEGGAVVGGERCHRLRGRAGGGGEE
jgi:hypothetical protein